MIRIRLCHPEIIPSSRQDASVSKHSVFNHIRPIITTPCSKFTKSYSVYLCLSPRRPNCLGLMPLEQPLLAKLWNHRQRLYLWCSSCSFNPRCVVGAPSASLTPNYTS